VALRRAFKTAQLTASSGNRKSSVKPSKH